MGALDDKLPELCHGAGHRKALLSGDELRERITRLSRPQREAVSTKVCTYLEAGGANFAPCISILAALLQDKKSPTHPSLPSAIAWLQTQTVGNAPLANRTQRLAETLWAELRPGREPTAPLLAKSLLAHVAPLPSTEQHQTPAAADFKRLLVASEAVIVALQVDGQIDEALVRLTASTAVAKSHEGIRFLAAILGSSKVSERVRGCIHAAVRAQLPFCRKSRAQCYGEVYFRAWKTAVTEKTAQVNDMNSDDRTDADNHLENFETVYLQSLMAAAIHAAKPTLRDNLLSFLMAFHAQKRHRGVDELLTRLYGPILFRSFCVANPLVRANAANIFIDAFPIHDPDAGLQLLEESIGKQVGLLLDLLQDPVVLVRQIAVQGSCRIVAVYWDILSAENLRAILKRIVKELAFDISASSVRAAVLDGIRHIFKENPISRETLKTAIVGLGPLLNDNSEIVRNSMVKFLLVLKEARAVSFLDVTPLPKLLARLALDDKPSIQLGLCNLLLNSYFPSIETNESTKAIVATQVSRCASLVKANPQAAVNFYSRIHLLSDLGLVCKFIKSLAKTMASNKSFPENGNRQADAEDTSAKLLLARESLLEILATLWTGCAKSVWRPGNEKLADYMRDAFTPDLLQNLAHPGLEISSKIHTACWEIARCLALDEGEGREVANSFLGSHWLDAFKGRLSLGSVPAALCLLSSAERSSRTNMETAFQAMVETLASQSSIARESALLLIDLLLSNERLRQYLMPGNSVGAELVLDAARKLEDEKESQVGRIMGLKVAVHSQLDKESDGLVEHFAEELEPNSIRPAIEKLMCDARALGLVASQ